MKAALFDAVLKDLHLLRLHRKDTVECEAIALRARHCGLQVDST